MDDVKSEVEEVETLNPSNEDESDELVDDLFSEVEEDDKEKEKSESEIDYINKVTGKKFTKEQLAEYIKQVDKDYAQKKVTPAKESQTKVETGTTVPTEIVERLLKVEEPLSALVMEEMKKVSLKTGQTIEELWKDESGYFKGKAQALNSKTESSKRISTPSNRVEGEQEDSEEKKMSQKFMKNFPPGIKIPVK